MPIECKDCDAQCCRSGKLFLLPEDMKLFARRPDIALQKIGSVGYYDLSNGCPFLKGNRCTIYKNRPINCRVFPFNIKVGPDGKSFCFDYGWCKRCDPGARDALITPEDWFRAYGITLPQHLGYACTWVIKEIRTRHALAALSREEIEECMKVEREMLDAAGYHEGPLPSFDASYLSLLFLFGQMTYKDFIESCSGKEFTTRQLMDTTMKQMKGLLFYNKNQVITY